MANVYVIVKLCVLISIFSNIVFSNEIQRDQVNSLLTVARKRRESNEEPIRNTNITLATVPLNSTIKSDNSTNSTKPTASTTVNLDNTLLLGVNGTGQSKDINSTKPTIVPEPIKEGAYQFYNSTTIVSKEKSLEYWSNLKNFTYNPLLSNSYREAVTVQLSFDFPFYGQPIRNVTIATGGFLYTGEHLHSWLATTQYIAPLMANFDPSQTKTSAVKYTDNGSVFRVVWENVTLQEYQSPFTFSASLHSNGDIEFAYLSIPFPIIPTNNNNHPVKIGLSDGYYVKKTIFFALRNTIYEYHRISFDSNDIQNHTMIYLTALPTCIQQTNCASCTNYQEPFKCVWCPLLNRCSSGNVRKYQEWQDTGCDKEQINELARCPAIGTKGNGSVSEQEIGTATNANSSDSKESATTTNGEYQKYTAAGDLPKLDQFARKQRALVTFPLASTIKSDNSTNSTKPTASTTTNLDNTLLLGVNGTGQSKDINSTKPAIVPEPIKEGAFQFYNRTTIVNKEKSLEYWSNLKNFTYNPLLSNSHRRAVTVQLSFDFPFYGQPIRNVTIATGGFLYTGDYVHSWLAATQYIAPLMANFDPSQTNTSAVKYTDNGSVFTVVWENVPLQGHGGAFTFGVSLHSNGDIEFAYLSIPFPITDDDHPVKIGLSDAYIIEKKIYFAPRKTIYEYHRINLDINDIQDHTIIHFTALPTCIQQTDCATCTNYQEPFKCMWCPLLNRCSNGNDRKRQEWLHRRCDKEQINELTKCSAIGTKGNGSVSEQEIGTPTNANVSDSKESATTTNEEYHKYTVLGDLPKLDQVDSLLTVSRERRELNEKPVTNTNITLVTVPLNSTIKSDNSTNSTKPTASTTINLENTRLLGVNGTGQRKDISSTKPTIVSEPISTDASKSTATTSNNNKNVNLMNKSEYVTQSPKSTDDDLQDSIISEIDKPFDNFNQTINDHLQNTTFKEETYQFYNSTTIVSKEKSLEYWSSLKNFTYSPLLSKSHRRAITVQLKFDFPFYGHPVRNVTIATGGFLYTGEYIHSWLAATQYIAPLMANFDTSQTQTSAVKYTDNGSVFTAVWENVTLQEHHDEGAFTFSASLHSNGDIEFAYLSLPVSIRLIYDDKHPVKIGLSDAYIIDKTIFFARRKTIYEYHRVNLEGHDIQNHTMIYLSALPTCIQHTDCATCTNNQEPFKCMWCPLLNRCSNGNDRKRQEWLHRGCDKVQINEAVKCPAIGTKGNNYASEQEVGTPTSSPDSKDSAKVIKAALSNADGGKTKGNGVGFFVGILLPIALIMCLVVWVFYAYRNPHTKSGQLLIQYRPSQWSWRRGEARYTAATIHM